MTIHPQPARSTKRGKATQAQAQALLAAQAAQAAAASFHEQQLPPDWHQLTPHQQNVWLFAVETYRARWEASH